ncbi:MAG: conjugal transfer protein TraF, partial [Pseudomonadota bacterium]
MTKLAMLTLAALAVAVTGPTLAQTSASPEHDAFYCEERKLGSWFYCNSEKAKREERERAAR